MNLLVTLDRHYLEPLNVLLTSILINNPNEEFDIFIISSDLTDELLSPSLRLCSHFQLRIHLIHIDKSAFDSAPTLRYYSKAMYYRLLAAEFLPETLDRILYLDPDMLVIGQLRPLYETDLHGMLYGACIHKGLVDLSGPVNKLRLSTYESEGYFNSGMLLMNLSMIRECVRPSDIFDYVRKNSKLLILPDQDILNSLYGSRIMQLDDAIWNYDARKYREYLLASQGEKTIEHVLSNTVILHFCGKRKPWNKGYSGRFSMLYRHYMQLASRYSSTYVQSREKE